MKLDGCHKTILVWTVDGSSWEDIEIRIEESESEAEAEEKDMRSSSVPDSKSIEVVSKVAGWFVTLVTGAAASALFGYLITNFVG